LGAELSGKERSSLTANVPAVVDDGAEDRCVRGRPADAELFQRLDERRLRVARWRLREVLLGLETQETKHFAFFERRRLRRRVLVRSCVLLFTTLDVHGGETLELHGLALRAKDRLPCLDVGRYRVVDRGLHLTGDEALPDQAIEGELILGQVARHAARIAGDVGGPDRLVRLLRASP